MRDAATKTGTRQVCLRLPVDQIEAFERIARADRRTRAEVMRLALTAALLKLTDSRSHHASDQRD